MKIKKNAIKSAHKTSASGVIKACTMALVGLILLTLLNGIRMSGRQMLMNSRSLQSLVPDTYSRHCL